MDPRKTRSWRRTRGALAGTPPRRLPMVRHNDDTMTSPEPAARAPGGHRHGRARRVRPAGLDRAVPRPAAGGAGLGVRHGRAWSLLLVLALVAVTVLVRQPFPETDGRARPWRASTREVTVLRDDAGIPQLYGDSTADLMLAQGFVHAQERFFEMDVRRHITSGRLSELFGEATVETDTFVRTLGWREVAEQEVALLEPGDPRRVRGVRRRRQRLPRPDRPRRARARVHRPRPRRPRLRARSRGPPPTRSPGSRRWRGTCAATWSRRSTGRCRCR